MENFPPIFCTATETVADRANEALHCNTPALPHRLDDMAEAIVREESPTLHLKLAELKKEPYLRYDNTNPAAYVDILSTIS